MRIVEGNTKSMCIWGISNSFRKVSRVSIDGLCLERMERMEDRKDIGRKGNGGKVK